MRLFSSLAPSLFGILLCAACGDGSSSPADDAGTGGDATLVTDSGGDSGPSKDDGSVDLDAQVLADSGLDGAVDAGPADAGPVFTFKYADVNHVLGTGQSLSVGSVGTPVLSTAQPYKNLMFNGGIKPGATGTALANFVPLVEGPTVETHNAAFSSLITQLAETLVFPREVAPKNSHRLLVSIHGIGGTAYVGLKKGTAAFAAGIAQVNAAKTLTTSAGQSYIVRAVTNVHGESDHVAANPNYKQNLVEWQHDYETDVRAITGQTEPIPMFHTQISSWTKYGQATSQIPMAQLDASAESGGAIVLVGAKYHLPYVADGVHLTNDGYRQMGEYYAKVYRRVVLEGKSWEPVRPKQVSLAGATITVSFHVPQPPLVFDTALVTNPGNYGFAYTDDSATPPTIQQVALDGPTSVKITLSAAPVGQNRKLSYAFTGTVNAKAGATTGPRGNLRDSDATPSRNGYALYNWGVHFESKL
jgi:hypothetical protein